MSDGPGRGAGDGSGKPELSADGSAAPVGDGIGAGEEDEPAVEGRDAPSDPSPGDGRRRHDRHEVRLHVHLLDADEYVRQYAHNLSRGGLYVAGRHEVAVDDRIVVELELPGAGRHRIGCRVAWVRADEEGGIGLEIVEAPPLLDGVLARYLRRLGARRDLVVMLAPSLTSMRELLTRAGYRVDELPGPLAVAERAERLAGRFRVVVPEVLAELYRSQLSALGWHERVLVADPEGSADDLLASLDRSLISRS